MTLQLAHAIDVPVASNKRSAFLYFICAFFASFIFLSGCRITVAGGGHVMPLDSRTIKSVAVLMKERNGRMCRPHMYQIIPVAILPARKTGTWEYFSSKN